MVGEIKRYGEVMQNKAADEFAAISQTPIEDDCNSILKSACKTHSFEAMKSAKIVSGSVFAATDKSCNSYDHSYILTQDFRVVNLCFEA